MHGSGEGTCVLCMGDVRSFMQVGFIWSDGKLGMKGNRGCRVRGNVHGHGVHASGPLSLRLGIVILGLGLGT